MKTYLAKKNDVTRAWYIVDADGKTLGRLATRIASTLIGKHRADFTPHADTGDFVVVVNAAKVRLTGKKWAKKLYVRHSQHPGGLRARTAGEVRDAHPTRLVELAVRGMLPLNKLRAQTLHARRP